MKKLMIPVLALVLALAVSIPPAAAARGHGWEHQGHREAPHAYHRGGECPGCGFLGGLFLGGVLGGVLAAPPVYAVPGPTCYTQPGYWAQVPYVRPDGVTTYQTVWVPPRTVCQ